MTASARERKARRTAEALKSAKERVQSASTLLFQLQANNVRCVELRSVSATARLLHLGTLVVQGASHSPCVTQSDGL